MSEYKLTVHLVSWLRFFLSDAEAIKDAPLGATVERQEINGEWSMVCPEVMTNEEIGQLMGGN